MLLQSGGKAATIVKRNSRPPATTADAANAGFQPEFTIHMVWLSGSL